MLLLLLLLLLLLGGGQVVRSVISLCQILGKQVHIFNIRHKRSCPGLAAQHLEGLNLVSRISRGRLINAFVKSTDVTFLPPPPQPMMTSSSSSSSPSSMSSSGGLESAYRADPGTAGAISLMLQVLCTCTVRVGHACNLIFIFNRI